MTSRTPMGVQPRPPQRTVSASSLSMPRPPPPHRTLSQQFVSPARKESSFIDLTNEPGDVVSGRYNTTPRRGGSRLRVEITNDSSPGPLSATSSPRAMTPSRIPVAEPVDASTMSPAQAKVSQPEPDNPPLPMPKRRRPAPLPVLNPRMTSAPPAPAKRDLRPKPYTVEIPSAAPRFTMALKDGPQRPGSDLFGRNLNSGHADFFPWTGNHHEDVWSSEAITKGTFDRAHPTIPENSSAKLALFPALKQKTGLSALSTVFMGVLNQRRHRGQVTAPSTFKPPPRVTLTDTKREVWLKDLANPAISLRRLSRTIPHGIRGRTLLDQCLNKNVPTERAVWLAKCVGANEIRAFKRKGVSGAFVLGGEQKWSRDWTVFVEQFLDGVVSAFGETDWKDRVTYAIRLATNLYSDQLLDRDHYLDWIVSGIENSPQSRIPMWILIAQIYWQDILRSRKFGRRLVYALLSHLHVIHRDPDRDLLIQLSNRLSELLGSLVKSNPESFVYPSFWPRYRETLHAFLPTKQEETKKALDIIQARNSRLLLSGAASTPVGRKQLVKLLDVSLLRAPDPKLSARCWALCSNKVLIVKTTVEWAISFHRPGLAKVYVATNLLRSWAAARVYITPAILDLLDGIDVHDETRKRLLYLLVTELVRSGHFLVPQYIQWVIARGGYHDEAEIDPEEGPCATRLLVELPLHALSEKKRTERGNLLRRAGNYSVAREEEDMVTAFKCIKQTLGLPLPPHDPVSQRKPIGLNKLLRMMAKSGNALRSCIGAQLRNIITTQPYSKEYSLLSTFTSVRAIMEGIGDFSMFSDILKIWTKVADVEILTSCADTVNSNLQIFSAIGSANDLFQGLVERLKKINAEHGIIPRALLASLSRLAQRIPGHEAIANQLRHELLQIDRNHSIDACSPVSDNMAPAVQMPEGEMAEEIEKLLGAGTSLDLPTMQRFFRKIIPRLESGWKNKDDCRRVYAALLTRIRVFESTQFDKLMTDWISQIRLQSIRPQLADIIPMLISTGCLTMPVLLSTATPLPLPMLPNPGPNQHSSTTYLQELLQLVIMPLPSDTGLTPEESYRFRTEQRCLKSEQPKHLLNLIRNALLEYSSLRNVSESMEMPLDETACQESLLETLRLLVLADSAAVSQALSVKFLPPNATGLVQKVTTKLLIPGDSGEGETSFDTILQLANELTLPFCQLKLNLDLSVSQANPTEGDDQGPSRFELFSKAMDRAMEAGNIMWTSLLPCLSDDITQHLKSQAHTGFLELVPSLKAANPADAASGQTIHMAENFLGVVEAIISGQPPAKTAQLSAIMVEKVSDLWEIVAAGREERPELHDAVLKHWLPAMLKFITLYSLSSESPSAPLLNASAATRPLVPTAHDIRARLILTLCGLLLELEAIPLAPIGSLPQQIFDIAILLVDALPEDVRSHCAKAILLMPGSLPSLTQSSDPRLFYLFSTFRASASDNLMLSHRDKSGPPSGSARGVGAQYGIGPAWQEKLSPFAIRRWEILSEPTPNVGENDTSLSLGLFDAIKLQ